MFVKADERLVQMAYRERLVRKRALLRQKARIDHLKKITALFKLQISRFI